MPSRPDSEIALRASEIQRKIKIAMEAEVERKERELSILSSAALFTFRRKPESAVNNDLAMEVRKAGD